MFLRQFRLPAFARQFCLLWSENLQKNALCLDQSAFSTFVLCYKRVNSSLTFGILGIVGRNTVHGNSVWTNAWSRNPLFSHIISIGKWCSFNGLLCHGSSVHSSSYSFEFKFISLPHFKTIKFSM